MSPSTVGSLARNQNLSHALCALLVAWIALAGNSFILLTGQQVGDSQTCGLFTEVRLVRRSPVAVLRRDRRHPVFRPHGHAPLTADRGER